MIPETVVEHHADPLQTCSVPNSLLVEECNVIRQTVTVGHTGQSIGRICKTQQANTVNHRETQQPDELSRQIRVFGKGVNVLADRVCEICRKCCFPKQVSTFHVTNEAPLYLPQALKDKESLVDCRRCKSHICSKKKYVASESILEQFVSRGNSCSAPGTYSVRAAFAFSHQFVCKNHKIFRILRPVWL